MQRVSAAFAGCDAMFFGFRASGGSRPACGATLFGAALVCLLNSDLYLVNGLVLIWQRESWRSRLPCCPSAGSLVLLHVALLLVDCLQALVVNERQADPTGTPHAARF
jgi:hypothetical protein